MSLGRSIRIYLKDGTVTGIKIGEVVNLTIQSLSCPRNRILELGENPESKRPGVYFLFGIDEETNERKAYIGEAENVYVRLQDHINNKEFWNEVIIFVSKDDNLTKSHVKYLESRIIQIAINTKRYKLENYNQAQLPAIPIADRDAMEEFLIYTKLLLGVLGHIILEDVITHKVAKDIPSAPKLDPVSPNTSELLKLVLTINNIKAECVRTDEGFVVLKGSEAALEIKESLFEGHRVLRQKLINDEVLVIEGNKLKFQRDQLFSTPSQSACIIAGFSINGRYYWKDTTGKTLNDIEATPKI